MRSWVMLLQAVGIGCALAGFGVLVWLCRAVDGEASIVGGDLMGLGDGALVYRPPRWVTSVRISCLGS